MPRKSRQLMLGKSLRPAFKDAGRMANENPDRLATIFQKFSISKQNTHDFQIWRLLENLGSDAVIKRASDAILHTRSTAELGAVLSAAQADGWTDLGDAINLRFLLKSSKCTKRKTNRDAITRLEALLSAGSQLQTPLDEEKLRGLLKDSHMRPRGRAASYALRMNIPNISTELLGIACGRGADAERIASDIGKWGDNATGNALWTRALAARKAGRTGQLHNYLRMLGRLGAFDAQLAQRFWIEEDFAKSEDAGWLHAEAWCGFVTSKLASKESSLQQAVEELRWFQHVAERSVIPVARMEGEGVFHLARGFVGIGALADATRLIEKVIGRSLPSHEKSRSCSKLRSGFCRRERPMSRAQLLLQRRGWRRRAIFRLNGKSWRTGRCCCAKGGGR